MEPQAHVREQEPLEGTPGPNVSDCPHPPTEGIMFDTIEELMAHLQAWGREHGYCFVRRHSSGKRKFPDGKTRYTAFMLYCDRGEKTKSTSQGLRRVSSRKIDCPWTARASCKKIQDWKWSMKVYDGCHNHPPSQDTSEHPMLRRLGPLQMVLLRMMSQSPQVTAGIAADVLRRNPGEDGNASFTMADIYNLQKQIRKEPASSRQLEDAFTSIVRQSREPTASYYRLAFGDNDTIKEATWSEPFDEDATSAGGERVEIGYGPPQPSESALNPAHEDSINE